MSLIYLVLSILIHYLFFNMHVIFKLKTVLVECSTADLSIVEKGSLKPKSLGVFFKFANKI